MGAAALVHEFVMKCFQMGPDKEKKMKAVKIIWRMLLGAGVVTAGWILMQPQMSSDKLTGGAVLGIGLMAVGVSVLAGVWD